MPPNDMNYVSPDYNNYTWEMQVLVYRNAHKYFLYAIHICNNACWWNNRNWKHDKENHERNSFFIERKMGGEHKSGEWVGYIKVKE